MPQEVSVPSPLVQKPAGSVETILTYSAADPTHKDEHWYIDINNRSVKNFASPEIQSTVHDLRGQEASTHIDTTGFQALTSPSAVAGELILNSSDEEVARIYYPEVEELIKKHTGASRVVFFDHTIRRPRAGPEDLDTPNNRKPVLRVHVDQTPVSAHRRVARHVVPPQPYKRFQLINVWRPLVDTVYDYPLAVCESHSVDVVKDLIPTTLLYTPPTPNGETYSVTYSKNHRWWYWSEMTPNDVLLLKCYDSAARELTRVTESRADVDENELRDVAGLTPHTAFFDKEGAKKGIERKSIEVRALVFYD